MLLTLGLAAPAVAGETQMADPMPGWDNPRKITLQLSVAGEDRVGSLLSNAANIQEFYGQDFVEITVVAFGPGVRALLADESPVPDRVSSLQKYGIDFVACGNTLEAMGRGPEGLIDGVSWVQAGIPEIVERELRGAVTVRP